MDTGRDVNQPKYRPLLREFSEVNGTGHGPQVKHELKSLQHQCHSKNFLNQFILGELSGARAAYKRVATISSFKTEALPS